VAFSVSEAPDTASLVHVDLACNGPYSCSLHDQYVGLQYSAKRGLQRGLRTLLVFGKLILALLYMGRSDVSEFEHVYGQIVTTPSCVYDR